jgi:drug/metabolite transporter (DMT)-like permease
VSPLGFVLLMGAVFCEACYVVIGKRLTGNVSPRRISALINLWGLALVTPWGCGRRWTFDFGAVRAADLGPAGVLRAGRQHGHRVAVDAGPAQVPAPRAGVFSVMLPVSAALVGVAVLGEPFTACTAWAFGMALAGVLLATWPAAAAPVRACRRLPAAALAHR